MAFTIMTFNIKGAFFNDGENNWEHRYPLNLQTIRRYAPDLIGFQEVQTRNLATYDEYLTEYDRELGPETARENSTGHGYFNAIYWNPQRFEKLDTGSFFLSQTPNVYSRDWEALEVRGVNWVKLRDLQTERIFLHLNSHFPHASELARMEGADVVAKQLAGWSADLPSVMTADFNSRAEEAIDRSAITAEMQDWIQHHMPPAGTVYGRFLAHGFQDTFTAAGLTATSTTNTFHRFMGKEFPPVGYRIDWILTRDGAQRWQTQSCQIITDEAPPLYPSDHYPVLATIELG